MDDCSTAEPIGSVNSESVVKGKVFKEDDAEWSPKVSDSETNDPPDKEKEESTDDKPESSRLTYSRDLLMKLSKAPSSMTWPSCLDASYNKSPGRWDPEKWMRAMHEGQSTPVAAPPTPPVPTTRPTWFPFISDDPFYSDTFDTRRAKDPRERVKHEEQENIVLSPQRRSFGGGCHGLQLGSSSSRPDSPSDRSSRDPLRDLQPRRIGSGRIVRRDEMDQSNGLSLGNNKDKQVLNRRDLNRDDQRNKDRDNDRDSHSRRDNRDWRMKSNNNNRFDRDDGRYDMGQRRYNMNNDDDDRPDRRKDRDRKYDRRKMSRADEDDTPEWFSGGPSSQNEFIELVGFEEYSKSKSKVYKKNKYPPQSPPPKIKEGSKKSSRSSTPVIVETAEEPEDVEKEEEKEKTSSTAELQENIRDNHQGQETRHQPTVVEPTANDQDSIPFNIDDFLGDIIGFPGAEDKSDTSRMKQFFGNRDSPALPSTATSRRSSLDFPQHMSNLMPEPNIMIPSPSLIDSTRFFAPISPAENTGGKTLMEMLNRNNEDANQSIMNHLVHNRAQPLSVKDLLMDGKGQSLEEVESSLRNNKKINAPQNHNFPNSSASSSQPSNMSAFTDFLSNGMKANMVKPNVIGVTNHKNVANNNQNPDIVSMSPVGIVNIPPPIPGLNLPRGNHPSMPPPGTHPSMPPPPQLNIDPARGPFPPQRFVHNRQFIQQLHQQPPSTAPVRKMSPGDPLELLISNAMAQMNMGASPQQCSIPEHVYHEALRRPDVKNLLQKVISFQVSEDQLVAQLQSGNITPSQRNTINIALALLNLPSTASDPMGLAAAASPTPQAMLGGGLNLGVNGPPLSPRVASPNPEGNTLNPHHMHQTRLSPLMMGPDGKNRGNQMPTHQELVVLSQNIMQKALIKQQLNKAKEKHRKLEAEKAKSPNPTSSGNLQSNGPVPNNVTKVAQEGSPTKSGAKCQSPLAFCPTSVMRKLTADKERHDRSDKSSSPGHDNTKELMFENAHQLAASVAASQPGLPNKWKGSSPIHPNGPPLPNQNYMNMRPNPGNPQWFNQRPPVNMHHNHPPLPNSWPMPKLGNCQGPPPMPQQMVPPQGRPQDMFRWLQMRMNRPVANKPQMPHGRPQFNNLEQGLQVPNMMNNPGSQRSSPVNLATLFGREAIAQLQVGAVPELPQGNVISVEDFERLQQQAVPN